MNIGEAAKRSGVSAKMIRHYESRGFLPAAVRAANGYRNYTETDIAALAFVRRARALGFSLDEAANLLGLWRNPARASHDVKELAQRQAAALEQRVREMRAMMRTLRDLAAACPGDDSAACPILDDLADAEREVVAIPGGARAPNSWRT